MQDFDRKLAEADAYLQILIDQVNALEARLDGVEGEEAEKRRHEQLRVQAKVTFKSGWWKQGLSTEGTHCYRADSCFAWIPVLFLIK